MNFYFPQIAAITENLLGLSLPSERLGYVQMVSRALLMFLILIWLLRSAKKRFLGQPSTLDVILVIVLGSIAARALTGGAPYFPSVLAMVAIILAHWILSLLARDRPWLGRLIKGNPTLLIRNGKIQRDELRDAHMSLDDLKEELRQKGVADANDVAEARLERSGKLSVLKNAKESRQQSLEKNIDEALQYAVANKWTYCTAESCSVGALASAFAKGNGAGKSLSGGLVAYTKEAKIQLLDVPESLLRTKGAVCAEVAEAMARGAARRSAATYAISITGVAGPSEDEDGNPVGLIYCAVANSESAHHVRLDLRSTDPEENVLAACTAATELLLKVCRSAAEELGQ